MFDELGRGPLFKIEGDFKTEGDCRNGRDCDPILGIILQEYRGIDELPAGAVCLASVVCRGLRRLTADERTHATE
ncbi:MAG TPA: hypothetical protein VJ836_00450 [Candidatus Saccharimonadales bacterium]|nr:hypothetical protein [Candidatus Saccharimonadales bacterium]